MVKRPHIVNDWLLLPDDEALHIRRLGHELSFQIEGRLADEVLCGDIETPLWRHLARREPALGPLCEALSESAPEVLTRDAVLKGSGWNQLFVELTAQCNERCVHCYAGSSPHRTEHLPWDIIEQALLDAKSLGFTTVQLTGGDPLISEHCLPAAKLASSLEFDRAEIYTNGILLRGALYESLRELNVSLALSFYSHDEQTHDAITQTKGSYRKTSDAIRRAVEDGLRTRVGVILMEQNAKDFERTQEYLVALGVAPEAIGVDQVRGVGRGVSDLLRIRKKDEAPMSRPSYSHQGGQGAASSAGNSSADLSESFNGSFYGSAAIGYDEMVYPCIFNRDVPLGSLAESRLSNILSSKIPVSVDAKDFDATLATAAQRLTCWQCQTRSGLLQTRSLRYV